MKLLATEEQSPSALAWDSGDEVEGGTGSWRKRQEEKGSPRPGPQGPRASLAVVPVVSQAICWSEQGMSYGSPVNTDV